MDLKQTLERHQKWLRGEGGGARADLSDADFRDADLRATDLRWADLSATNLCGANLHGANLGGADLRASNLRAANLCEASLRATDLRTADLSGADLSGATLCAANLWGANLSGTKGLLDPVAYLSTDFEQVAEGIIAYKTFGAHHAAPNHWRRETGAVLEEIVNFDRTVDCACGVNVATLKWVQANNPDLRDIWRCLIRWEWLPGVVVPYHTDGKIRASKVQLLEKLADAPEGADG